MKKHIALLLGLASVGCGGDEPSDSNDAGTMTVECSGTSCDDGVFCNGVERCEPDADEANSQGCVAGRPPCSGACNESAESCVTSDCADNDGDGHAEASCGGDDCDDSDPDRYPGNSEICDEAGHDEDCNDSTLGPDADGDGFASTECCNGATCGTDCDDTLSGIRPGAVDGCGGGDEDCDGEIDETPDSVFYRDEDNDNYGSDSDTVMSCSLPSGYAVRGGDCDDNPFDDPPEGPTSNEIRPGASEICDEVDNDCDMTIDEVAVGQPPCACLTPGETRECGVDPMYAGVGLCVPGTQSCVDGAWGSCVGARGPATEICDGQDNDCDGQMDEGTQIQCWIDGDGDGTASGSADSELFCGVTCPTGWTANSPGEEADCDDMNAEARPGLGEACDGDVDNDCDGETDEGCNCSSGDPPRTCASQGFRGACSQGTQTCTDGQWQPPCPAASTEICGTFVDEDCDGVTGESEGASGVVSRYFDADEDGFGSGALQEVCPGPRWSETDGDCDDGQDGRYPGAIEQCNSIDDDCDMTVDEDAGIPQWPDMDDDGHGHGDPASPIIDCLLLAGNATSSDDCDDSDPFTYTGAPERCDGVDNNCDSVSDATAGSGASAWCMGRPNVTAGTCVPNGPGSVRCELTCVVGWDDCDGASMTPPLSSMTNGCEHDVSDDDQNCGACGVECSDTTYCGDNLCRSCGPIFRYNCDPTVPQCETMRDTNNCSFCGDACESGSTCQFHNWSTPGPSYRCCGGFGEECCPGFPYCQDDYDCDFASNTCE